MVEGRVVGPGFYGWVRAVVRMVPPGRVTTYGQVATRLGSPRVARHVGWALAGDVGGDVVPVPWHRVVNSRGRISHGGDPRRGRRQRALLEAEGIEFNPEQRIDLNRYRWHFPDFVHPGAS